MNRTLKALVSFIMIAVLLFSLAINVFAASASYKVAATCASQELIDVTCNYYSLKKDNFTVKNNGTVPMFIYVNRCYQVTLQPGQSYTQPKSHAFKHRVQVYAQRAGYGYQKISITSTSGNIYNT